MVWETQVRSLGWEDPLEKDMATHPSILSCRIPWTEEPGGLQSTGSQRVGHDWATTHTHLDFKMITLSWFFFSPSELLFLIFFSWQLLFLCVPFKDQFSPRFCQCKSGGYSVNFKFTDLKVVIIIRGAGGSMNLDKKMNYNYIH